LHISILTASGKFNLGDELILKQEYTILKKFFPEASFSIFTYDRASTLFQNEKVEFISFFPNKIKSRPLQNVIYLIQNIIAIAKSNLVVMGGG